MMDDILAGTAKASISHAGGELSSMFEEWEREAQGDQ
jgi:hypothetical protein